MPTLSIYRALAATFCRVQSRLLLLPTSWWISLRGLTKIHDVGVWSAVTENENVTVTMKMRRRMNWMRRMKKMTMTMTSLRKSPCGGVCCCFVVDYAIVVLSAGVGKDDAYEEKGNVSLGAGASGDEGVRVYVCEERERSCVDGEEEEHNDPEMGNNGSAQVGPEEAASLARSSLPFSGERLLL